MKLYVTADTHGFYSILRDALTASGFFVETAPHKLVILGDLFDRGAEALEMQDFILQLMEEDRVILVKGNHEDLFVEMVTEDAGLPYSHHVSNGTYDTALQLTGYDHTMARIRNFDFAEAARETSYYKTIIPAMVDYYETKNYVFTHGWIPCIRERSGYSYYSDWRLAQELEWKSARWYNGMDAAQSADEDKIVLCGHWHCSYGHAKYEHKGSEFGPDADFTPYYGPGVIALDACTTHSKRINVIILDDELIKKDEGKEKEMVFIKNDQSNTWGTMTYTEKNRALFLQQKQTLDLFLERGAISQAQHDKSLHDLTAKMRAAV